MRATHKFASSSANNAQTWVANWTAPTSGTGSVTFYVAAMAANGNGNNRGEKMYIDTISISENISASIADIENWNINLYPNPTTQTISIDGYTNTNSKLKVINQTGKVMMDVNFNNSLDVSALSTGTYYLKIYENNRVFMKRFTKL